MQNSEITEVRAKHRPTLIGEYGVNALKRPKKEFDIKGERYKRELWEIFFRWIHVQWSTIIFF